MTITVTTGAGCHWITADGTDNRVLEASSSSGGSPRPRKAASGRCHTNRAAARVQKGMKDNHGRPHDIAGAWPVVKGASAIVRILPIA
jgi:hypothetical protein